MKKKVLGIALAIIVVIAAIIVFNCIKKNDAWKIRKGNEIFGNEICQGHEHEVGLTVMTSFKCKICEKQSESGHAPASVICKLCADITGRCTECGKIK